METIGTEEEILQAFLTVMPYLPNFFDDDISIGLTNKKVFLCNQTCKSLPVSTEAGNPIPEGGGAAVAIKTGTVVIKEVSKDVYDVAFKSYAVPLKNKKGEIVGCALIARNLERSKRLLGISKKLTSAFGQISGAVSELTEDVQKLAQSNNQIGDKSEKATEYTKRTNEVLNMIQKIAAQSNLLGLNASIEASRAGEVGKGFQVVAQEIRKMSANTTDSIKKISMVLKSIEDSIIEISSEIKESNSVFHGHITILEDITKSMTELHSMAQKLEELSEQI